MDYKEKATILQVCSSKNKQHFRRRRCAGGAVPGVRVRHQAGRQHYLLR